MAIMKTKASKIRQKMKKRYIIYYLEINMTTLTRKEELLIELLKILKVNKETTVNIMMMLYKTEEKMDALVEYIKNNREATPAEILAKAKEISATH